MFAKAGTNAVQGDRIDARVDVSQHEADDFQSVPERVVIGVRIWIEIEPQKVQVHWSKADGEQDDERLF